MKCAKCGKERALSATEHGCGWRAGAGGFVSEKKDEPHREEERAAPGVVEAHLEKIRQTLSRKPSAGRYKVDRADPPPPCLSDVGHGTLCTCEVCWQMRMLEIFPTARVKVTVPGASGTATSGGGSPPVAPPVAVTPAVQQSGGVSLAPDRPLSRLEKLAMMFPVSK